LIELKNKNINAPNKVNVYLYKTGQNEAHWSKTLSINKRTLDSVFISKKQKQELIGYLDNFYSKKGKYDSLGIPHQAGILLEGPPGTGKTSIIKAIASYYNKSICYFNANNLDYLQDALISLPNDTLFVIEDIDSSEKVNKRKDKNITETTINVNSGNNNKEAKKPITLSEILNSIDGILSIPDRVLFFTTNHQENIDPALLRPGRIDLNMHIGYITEETFIDFCRVFYNVEIKSAILKEDNIMASQLQNDFIVKQLSIEQLKEKYLLI
jgi:chaperone BCS1